MPPASARHVHASSSDRERARARKASGSLRLTSAVCGECARKLSMEGTFWLVTSLPPLDCKSIA